MRHGSIGLVLGSGSARGWAHIGVIRALANAGIAVDFICGTSIGALVGAAHASSNLDALEQWVRALTLWDVVRLMDVKLEGGLIEGASLMTSFRDKIRDVDIEQTDIPFAAVATDLSSGQEVWLQEGRLPTAVRAAIALPGLFSPVRVDGRWLVDGGLVNPVPISLCRAMGADLIIAVNLNSDIVSRHRKPHERRNPETPPAADAPRRDLFHHWLSQLNLRERAKSAWHKERGKDDVPGMLEVFVTSINIRQDRNTKSRMVGDPPDLLLTPRLGHLGLLEYERADEAIAEGRACVERELPQLQLALERIGRSVQR